MLALASRLGTIRARRRALLAEFDIARQFEQLEESCVPSYCHPNILAAAVSWWRLSVAADLYRRHALPGRILDFGAATGELRHLLDSAEAYDFVEENPTLAAALARAWPDAEPVRLEALHPACYATVFALDSLEHNRDVGAIVARLAAALRPGGRLILSGPTESRMYRLGRRLAGFDGHYHTTTVTAIEGELASRMTRIALRRLPPLVPLFRLSVWQLGAPT